MRFRIQEVLFGVALIAFSFWVTLLFLEDSSDQDPAATSAVAGASAANWNEALYLAVNRDVANAIANKQFTSGRDHYERAGRAEGRQGGAVPSEWNEAQYVQKHPDVAAEVSKGNFLSGYHHYLAAGREEGRRGGFPPGRPPDK